MYQSWYSNDQPFNFMFIFRMYKCWEKAQSISLSNIGWFWKHTCQYRYIYHQPISTNQYISRALVEDILTFLVVWKRQSCQFYLCIKSKKNNKMTCYHTHRWNPDSLHAHKQKSSWSAQSGLGSCRCSHELSMLHWGPCDWSNFLKAKENKEQDPHNSEHGLNIQWVFPEENKLLNL